MAMFSIRRVKFIHRLLIALVAFTMVFPALASAATLSELHAQVARLMQQLLMLQQGNVPSFQKQVTTPTQCPTIARTLSRDMRGVDVTQLQDFLIAQGDLVAEYNTGFFGRLTETAVKTFQCREIQICSGTPESTGYGKVGPMTRARIAAVCNTSLAVVASSQDPDDGRGSGGGMSCMPLPTQTQTLSCPAGQTGAITQTRSSSCPGPTWSSWTTTSNTCSITTTYSWNTGEWGVCVNSQQTRPVQCKSKTGTVVADSFCAGTKPATSQNCTGAPLSCTTPWGASIPHASSTTAYQSQAAVQCVSQTRSCSNGVLSGTYQYESCSTQTAQLPNPTVKNMEGVRGGFRNVYAPSVATVAAGPATTARRMWLCGWKTDADPNNYNAAVAAGQSLTSIVGPDKIWMSEYNGTSWSDPVLSFQKTGFHVCDPSIVRPPSTDGVDRSQWTYMYYTGLDNRFAASPTEQVQNNITGMASSVDGGTTWTDLGIILNKADGGDGYGAWAASALVVGDEIWLYYVTGNQNFSINATYRQRMNANGWQKIGAPEPLTYAPGLQFNEGTQATLLSNLHVHKEGSKYVMLANTYDLKRVVRLVSDNGLSWRSETIDPVIMNSGANFVITPFAEPIDAQNFSLYFGYGDTPPLLDSHGVHKWTFGW